MSPKDRSWAETGAVLRGRETPVSSGLVAEMGRGTGASSTPLRSLSRIDFCRPNNPNDFGFDLLALVGVVADSLSPSVDKEWFDRDGYEVAGLSVKWSGR